MSDKKITIGDVIAFGLGIPEEKKMLHINIGSHGVEYLLKTLVTCLNKIKDTDPKYSENVFKELSEKLQKGCAEGEGCYRVTSMESDSDV